MSAKGSAPAHSSAPSANPSSPAARAHAPRATWIGVLVRVISWVGGLAVAGVLSLLILVGIAVAVAYPNVPEISGLTDYRPKLPMRIYAADGVLLGEFGEERRNFTPISQMPQVMKDAVLAAEDARFYEHGGVDYKGIVRAALANLRDARSQGGSTITMQVAKNFYLPTEKTYTRKIYELLLTWKIEKLLTKEQILELYMNQIYLGQRAYGFAAASEIYFGKPVKDLTIAESAMLAALPVAPSAYNPIVNPKRATVRQQFILGRMLEEGFIDDAQYAAARQQTLRYREQTAVPVHAEYAVETARQLVFAQYGADAYSRGLDVHLTIRSADQEVAYRALRRGLMNYEQRQWYRGPEAYVDLPAAPEQIDARIAEALAEHPDNDELRAAVVLEASPRKVVAVLQNGETISVSGDGLKPVASGLTDKAGPKLQIRRGAVVRALRDAKGNWSLTQVPEVEGAFVAMDPNTGAIRTLVGGFDYGKSKFNHVTQAWRQPGSSFKPFIYSAALERGFMPSTVVNDAPLFFNAGATGSQPWEPKNYDGKFEGPMPLRTALAKSKNMVSIRILQAIGPGFAQEWITRFGFEADKHPAYLTMALGAGSVTPMQMATAFSVFANGGYMTTPALIAKVTDSKGKVLSQAAVAPLEEAQRVLDARNAFVMNTLLQEVTRSGTAASAKRALGRGDIFGKTGTTNDSMDAWFAGYQPSLVAVVWIGYDTPRKLGERETGGGLALPVWIEYMSYALKGVPVRELTPPEGVVQSDGDWAYEEFSHGAGVRSLGLEDVLPPAPTSEERNSILDLFRR
ncbi:MAG TPA: penicillin-binding protein 1A [Rubrivivax sp.]|nr:penicillin-binding protein 1A [Rubrivivax sp.]